MNIDKYERTVARKKSEPMFSSMSDIPRSTVDRCDARRRPHYEGNVCEAMQVT